ncbi:hypothetical protein [Streptomyces sp. H27-H1]|uniref:hypothetical protein n=1 Tax=Streptomyces sp. H27-H1 TaxID=2996461 RepID=UPI003B63E22A
MRPSAAERQESVLRAAVAEFATGGYHDTSTEVTAFFAHEALADTRAAVARPPAH